MSKKQISLVLEIEEKEDDIELIKSIKKFLKNFEYVDLVGVHTKKLKNFRC